MMDDGDMFPLMMLIGLLGLTVGVVIGLCIGMNGTVSESELTQSGYSVVRHMVSHGEFHTNWVEVIRK